MHWVFFLGGSCSFFVVWQSRMRYLTITSSHFFSRFPITWKQHAHWTNIKKHTYTYISLQFPAEMNTSGSKTQTLVQHCTKERLLRFMTNVQLRYDQTPDYQLVSTDFKSNNDISDYVNNMPARPPDVAQPLFSLKSSSHQER